MHKNSEDFPSFSSWLVLTKKESGQLLKTICVDKGDEFTSNAMVQLCLDSSIKKEFANTGTPSKNGVIEMKEPNDG